jgi:hypothetical protein
MVHKRKNSWLHNGVALVFFLVGHKAQYGNCMAMTNFVLFAGAT